MGSEEGNSTVQQLRQNPVNASRPMPDFTRKVQARKRVMSPLKKLAPPKRLGLGPVKQEVKKEFAFAKFAAHPYKVQRACPRQPIPLGRMIGRPRVRIKMEHATMP